MSIDFFKTVLFEDEGDMVDAAPPDDTGAPPDLGDDGGMDIGMDMGDGGGMDMGMDMGDEFSSDDNANDEPEESEEFDDKISNTLNATLYNQFLKLLNTINSQVAMLKNNNDVVYTIAPETSGIFSEYMKLEDNVSIYLNRYFNSHNYSENLLFFNKALNLLKMLNERFDKFVNDGIKSAE